MADSIYRVYVHGEDVFDGNGYPLAWHDIKHLVREHAGHRCQRCRHPYHVGLEGSGEWTLCDELCDHDGPIIVAAPDGVPSTTTGHPGDLVRAGWLVQAQWRVLTVHHLNGVKADCRWWNLVALCQRCHLQIQAKVKLDRPWPWPHSDWFQPNVAAWYALKYLAEDLSREETMERLVELLTLGQEEEAAERLPL